MHRLFTITIAKDESIKLYRLKISSTNDTNTFSTHSYNPLQQPFHIPIVPILISILHAIQMILSYKGQLQTSTYINQAMNAICIDNLLERESPPETKQS